MVIHPVGRTSDAQLLSRAFFYAIRVVTRNILLRLPSREQNCPSGESSFFKQRDVQPFLCHRAGAVLRLAYRMMQYATDNSDWAGSALDSFQSGKDCKELERKEAGLVCANVSAHVRE